MAEGSVVVEVAGDVNPLRAALSKLGDVAGRALGGVSKMAGSMLASLGTAALNGAAALGKAVLSSYAEYEQLVGGVDTLFKDSSAQLQQYAANAYKTAGMSANQYMATVTGFSASLIQSLGGDTGKAAQYADMAVTDMADNVNKFGGSMESVQTAYQGFAKQNYTMLDNLKLGYGGTKEEMQRLLTDAQAISGVKYDISSYADVVAAIHVIQDEMGVAGATAQEAEKTISGSMSTLKASWSNFVTGLGDANANLDVLVANLMGAFSNVVTNITPVVEQLVTALPGAFEQMIPAVQGMLPLLITTATQIFLSLLNSLTKMLPSLVPVAVDGILTLARGLIANLPLILNAAVQIVMSLVTGLIEMAPELAIAAISILGSLMTSIGEQLPTLIPMVVEVILAIVQGLIDNLDLLIDGAISLVTGLAQGIVDSIPLLVERLPELMIGIVNGIIDNLPTLLAAGLQIIVSLAGAMIDAVPKLIARIPELLLAIVSGVGRWISKIWEAGINIVKGIWQGISNGFTWIKNKIKEWVGDVLDFIKRLFGINSPSKVMADEIGKWLPPGIAIGFEVAMPDTLKKMKKQLGGMMHQMQAVVLGGQGALQLSYSAAGGIEGTPSGGDTYQYNQTVNTHDSLSPSELTQQFQAMEARRGFLIP